jgi:uncharacterized protein (TIGR02594 family)
MAEAPPWLNVMRSLTGTKEVAGAGANPVITGMTTEIGRRFPEMKTYCNQKAWDSDETPWCGVAIGYCMAMSEIRPPFKSGADTDCFGWARSWADDPNYTVLKTPRLGCVVVLSRSGGGHVTLYESTSGSNYMCRGGNQSNAVTLAPFPKSNVVALVWPNAEPVPAPIEPPSGALPILRKGSTGPAVVKLQELLPKWIDGDFGSTTDALVREFQRSQGLAVDGVVGEATWAALLDEEPALPSPPPEDLEPSGWIHGITATWFGGLSETEKSAYAPYDRITATEISVALPYRFKGTLPTVEVMNEDGDMIPAIIRDVGPWMIDDPYWETETRPVAETCFRNKTPLPSGPQKGRIPSNPAGIDLSAALAEDLGIGGMGKVSWRLVK